MTCTAEQIGVDAAIHGGRDFIDDFLLAVDDFADVDTGPTVDALTAAFQAMKKAIETARQEEQAAMYWTKKIADWSEWSRMPEGNTKTRAARLVCGDFADTEAAIDFLSCPPLTGIDIDRLTSGERMPRNAYEVFASRRRGGLAGEMEIAEQCGPVERYTYRLRMLRGLGESRTKIYRWRRLARRCGFRLINRPTDTHRKAPSVVQVPAVTGHQRPVIPIGTRDDPVLDYSMARVRDGP